MSKSIKNLSSVTRVGLDGAKNAQATFAGLAIRLIIALT